MGLSGVLGQSGGDGDDRAAAEAEAGAQGRQEAAACEQRDGGVAERPRGRWHELDHPQEEKGGAEAGQDAAGGTARSGVKGWAGNPEVAERGGAAISSDALVTAKVREQIFNF